MQKEFVVYSAERILKLETLYQSVLQTKKHFETNMPSHVAIDAVIEFCDELLQDFKGDQE